MGLRGNCVICTDFFGAEQNISVTFCGHLFHEACLSQWLRQCGSHRTCPQCRSKLSAKQIVQKLYINVPETGEDIDPFELQNRLDEVNSKYQKIQVDQKETKKLLKEAETQREKLKSTISKLRKDVKQEKHTSDFLRNELELAKMLEADAVGAKSEAKRLREKLQTCEKVEFILHAGKGEVDEMIKQYASGGNTQKCTQQLATFCVALKQEYATVTASRTSASNEIMKLKKELQNSSQQLMSRNAKCEELKETIARMRESEEQLLEENKGLKRKVGALQSAISSPSDTRSSAITRLLAESPAPLVMTPLPDRQQHTKPTKRLSSEGERENQSPLNFKRPKLSNPDDLDAGAGTSANGSFVADRPKSSNHHVLKSKVAPDSPNTLKEKKICKDMGIRHVKVKSSLTSRTIKSGVQNDIFLAPLRHHNGPLLGRPSHRITKFKMSSRAKPVTTSKPSTFSLQAKLNFL